MKDLQKNVGKLLAKNKIVVNNFEKSFADRFPKAFKVYYILKTGSRRFAQETSLFLRIKKDLIRDPIKCADSLKWNEVNVYREIPRDWKAVAPVMIIAAFPFLNYIILPLAYIYPQQLLCKQFWTQKQQLTFHEAKFKSKLVLYDRVFIDLKEQIDTRMTRRDDFAKNLSIDLLDKIGKSKKVDVCEIIELNKILNRPEMNLDNLSPNHLQNLVDLTNCQRVFTRSPIKNLEHYAYWLNQEDRKLMTENLDKIDTEYISNFAFERGVNANQHSLKELVNYLQMWTRFSTQLGFTTNKSRTENNYTLYLHAKVLLSRSCMSSTK